MDVISDGGVPKNERQCYYNLESDNQCNAGDQLDRAKIVLHLPKKSWQQQNQTGFHTEAQREEKGSQEGPIQYGVIYTQNEIENHDLIVVHGSVVASFFTVT